MDKRQRLYYKGNRLPQLRAFCHAAWQGSLRRAAESLFLHQPTLSLQIQALERELGVTLLQRTPKGVKLTPDGKVLLEIAEPLLDGIDSLPRTFQEKRSRLIPELVRMAVSSMSVRRVMPDALVPFLKANPDAHLRVFGRKIDDVIQQVVSEEVDLGFGPYCELPSEVEFLACVHFNMVAITSQKHPFVGRRNLRLEEIVGYPLVLCEVGTLQNETVVERLKAQQYDPRIVLETSEWDIIRKCVQESRAVGIVSEGWLDQEARATLNVIDVAHLFGTRMYGFLRKRGRHLSACAESLALSIQKAFE